MKIITKDGRSLFTTDIKMRAFAIGIPHQRPAYVCDPKEHPPIEEDGDSYIEGDHDLHGFDAIESLEDAMIIIGHRSGDLHQIGRRAILVENELISQGVLREEDDD